LIAEAGSEGRPPDKEKPQIGSVNTLRRGNGDHPVRPDASRH